MIYQTIFMTKQWNREIIGTQILSFKALNGPTQIVSRIKQTEGKAEGKQLNAYPLDSGQWEIIILDTGRGPYLVISGIKSDGLPEFIPEYAPFQVFVWYSYWHNITTAYR